MRTILMLAILSFITMWSSAVVLADGIQKASEGDKYNYEQIYISLPVYIVSLIATAGFIWAVAKYDNRRSTEIKDLRNEITRAVSEMCKFPLGCDDCEYRMKCKMHKTNK